MEEEKTLTIKASSVWKVSCAILAILLVASILTGGFGIKGATTGSAVQNTQETGTTQQQAVDLSVFESNSDIFPSAGPDNAKNVVVEFADFQCPYCALASGLPSWASQYATQYGSLIGVAKSAEQAAEDGQIKFIFVTMSFLDNPQSQYGTESTYAAEAGFCANDQGKFWEMHDAIYAASDGPSESTGKYTKANLEKIAQGISGLDQAKFKECLENDTDLSKVQQSQKAASQVVQGTPSFFVNGQQVNPSWSAIQAALQ